MPLILILSSIFLEDLEEEKHSHLGGISPLMLKSEFLSHITANHQVKQQSYSLHNSLKTSYLSSNQSFDTIPISKFLDI